MGNHWNRRVDETEDAFKDRAASETPRKENQVVLLFGNLSASTSKSESLAS
jgi:hypothetical protein